MAVGVVTNTEIEDATPAAMVAHTRRRADYDEIVEQFFEAKPDVMMGGGIGEFPAEGGRPAPSARTRTTTSRNSAMPATRSRRRRRELKAAAADKREHASCSACSTPATWTARSTAFLKKGTRAEFPDQPDLTDQMQAALDMLSRNDDGFRPDGRIRPDRQIQPRARLGARRLRHHHARQRGAAGARLGARRAATTR